jgi:hypothetical protein
MGETDSDPPAMLPRSLGFVEVWGAFVDHLGIRLNSLRVWMYPETYVERNRDVQNGEGFLI